MSARGLAPLLGICAILAACRDGAEAEAGRLSLSFGTHGTTPVVLTELGIERPRGPIGQADLIHSFADREYPFTFSGASISAPVDAGGDGIWRIEALWADVTTGTAWAAGAEVAADDLVESFGALDLAIVFGPNGLMEVLSEAPGPKPVSEIAPLARTCGRRAPASDFDWLSSGRFPGALDRALAGITPPVAPPACPPPQE